MTPSSPGTEVLAEGGKWPEAETAFRQAVAIWEKLAADFPAVPMHVLNLAIYCDNLGNVLRDSGQPAAAEPWYAKALAALEPLLARKPPPQIARRSARDVHSDRATALTTLARHTEALKDWDDALALDDQKLPEIRVGRARSLARMGDYLQATAEANALADAKNAPPKMLYDLACVCALSSTAAKDDARLREQYAARAIELLRQAVSTGYKDIEHLKNDEELKALRPREDYRKLLTELEAK